MPSHTVLVAAIITLTLLGFAGILVFAVRHHGNEHDDDRDTGELPLTA